MRGCFLLKVYGYDGFVDEEFPPRLSLAFIAIRARFSSFQIEFRRGKLFAPDIKLIFWESVCLLAVLARTSTSMSS